MPRKESPRSVRHVRAEARADIAIDCRKAGLTLKQIALTIAKVEGAEKPLTEASVSKILQRAFERLCARTDVKTEGLRQLELLRLDALIAGLWDLATSGHADSVRQLLGVLDRRYKLLGIEPAKRIEHDVRGMTWVQLMASVDERTEGKIIDVQEAPLALLTEGVEEDEVEDAEFEDDADDEEDW